MLYEVDVGLVVMGEWNGSFRAMGEVLENGCGIEWDGATVVL